MDKIYAIVLWESGWVSKIEPGILNEILDLVASHDYDLYVWAWQGVDHLEAWDDLQTVFAGFIQKAKQIRPRASISQAMDTVLDYIEENRHTSSPETLNYQEGLGNILEYRRVGVAE